MAWDEKKYSVHVMLYLKCTYSQILDENTSSFGLCFIWTSYLFYISLKVKLKVY